MGALSRWFAAIRARFNKNQGDEVLDIIPVGSVTDEYDYLQQHPCTCGGSWDLEMQAAMDAPGQPSHVFVDRLTVRCDRCGKRSAFHFQIDTKSAAYRSAFAKIKEELDM
jgi:hypothetical protein